MIKVYDNDYNNSTQAFQRTLNAIEVISWWFELNGYLEMQLKWK